MSREVFIKCNIYIKLYVFFFVCFLFCYLFLKQHQITRWFRGVSLRNIYIKLYVFRGVSQENVIKCHMYIKLHVCLGACHGKMSLNSIYTSNDMFWGLWNLMTLTLDIPLKICLLTCIWNLMTYFRDALRKICHLKCILNLITFSRVAHLIY